MLATGQDRTLIKKYNNKIAIVTGAGSGIGKNIAIELSKYGCNLVLVDVCDEGLNESIMMLDSQIKFWKYVVDVSKLQEIKALKNSLDGINVKPSLIFNIAGIAHGGFFWEVSEDSIDKVIETNFLSQAYIIRVFLDDLMCKEDAHIMNMSSCLGLFELKKQSLYVASKNAVKGFSHALYYELKHTGVMVTVSYPGAVSTNIVKNSIPPIGYEKGEGKYESIAKGLDAKKVATVIIKGVAKNKRDIIIGQDTRMAIVFKKLFPKTYVDKLHRIVDMEQ